MPRVTIYPAFSCVWDAVRVSHDLPETVTALQIKRLVGHDATSWLYAELPRHEPEKRCRCYSCAHTKDGWFQRPGWVPESEWIEWHRWLRADIGASNVRLALRGGERFTVVALVDMPRYAARLCEQGRHGKIMALDFFLSPDAARAKTLREAA